MRRLISEVRIVRPRQIALKDMCGQFTARSTYFSVNTDGTGMKRLTNTDGYDAEGTVSPDGKKIVFTSARDGDLDIYDMNIDGTQVRRLTNELGYDGGPWHSQDGQWIVWRASRPKTPDEVTRYKDLFAKNLVMPVKLEIMIMKADGTQKRQLTSNGAANFAPYFHPNGDRSYLHRTSIIRIRGARILICISSIEMEPDWSRSPSMKVLTVSRCSRMTARNSSGHRTVTE